MARVATVVALAALLLLPSAPRAQSDHLKCYKVKPENVSPIEAPNRKRPTTTSSTTGLGDENCEVDNRKPKFCCDAVDRDGGVSGYAQFNQRFCCYKAKCSSVPATLGVDDAFFNNSFWEPIKSTVICLPGAPSPF